MIFLQCICSHYISKMHGLIVLSHFPNRAIDYSSLCPFDQSLTSLSAVDRHGATQLPQITELNRAQILLSCRVLNKSTSALKSSAHTINLPAPTI